MKHSLFRNYEIIDKLDFRNNKKQLINSYLLRLLGVLVFGGLFYAFVYGFKNEVNMKMLLNIEINGLSSLISILLLIIHVVFVLYLHEMIHAAVFCFTHGQKPKTGMRGFVIFAAAPQQILTKNQVIVNAMAPFTIISIIGLSLVLFMPGSYFSWIFIPTLVNAAAAGGDFMTVYFVKKHPKTIRYNDVGDILYALKLRPAYCKHGKKHQNHFKS